MSNHDSQLLLLLVLRVSLAHRRNRGQMGVSAYLPGHPAYAMSWKRDAFGGVELEGRMRVSGGGETHLNCLNAFTFLIL